MIRMDSIREGAILAIDQLRANLFRSSLTILGIVVGVATVMWMSAMVTGIRTSIIDSIESAGPKNFYVARWNMNEVQLVNHDGPPWGSNPRVSVDEARRLGALSTVHSAIVGLDLNREMVNGRQRLSSVAIYARGAGWSNYMNGDFSAGHDMLPSDEAASSPVIILSAELADALFGALDPVGRPLRVGGGLFTVIGVFEPAPNIFTSLQKNFAIVPYTAALKHLQANTDMLGVFIATASHATQDAAMDQVIATMRSARGLRPGEANNFAVIRQEEMVEMFNRVTGVFFIVMIALSSVALMVGGVGVIAIMMIAVTERTREIGIRKALGATKREILLQFLIEATTVTVIGGVIGMVIGAVAAFAVAALTPIPAAVPLGGVVAALAMATVAGVVFGMWPAWRAARMDPVEALRYE
jgi:putative ABC transport system permease protein